MTASYLTALDLSVETETRLYKAPFSIAGYTRDRSELLIVHLRKDGLIGSGEAAGVRYRGESARSMQRQIEAIRTVVETGISRGSLQALLPPGGARNALDCALWDLEAKLTDRAAWELAGLKTPRALLTTFTCGADMPENMASAAREYANARAIKIKLTGEPADFDRVRAVREARPDVWLCVDANQGFTRPFLEQLMPVLVQMKVAMIEQPFPVGQEALLDGFESPLPIAADESVQSLVEVSALVGRFNVMNIKLDKCGGLTEGLAMARKAHSLGLETMVGNMIGTSLAMAPAYLVGQLCTVVDLDGPVFLKSDRPITVDYTGGLILCPADLWGGSH